MNKSFVKYPRTYHVMSMGALHRDDKLLTPLETELFFTKPVAIEEKVDGTNLGFSLNEEGNILVQNRGNYIDSSSHPQFKLLKSWISCHEEALLELLLDKLIIFGEWCYARHSIHYDSLPDWFLVFDIFDRNEGRFLSRKKRHDLIKGKNLYEVPLITEKLITKRELISMLESDSVLYDGPIEGVYLRLDSEDGFLLHRAKVVRPEFIQSIELHWTKQKLVQNRLKMNLGIW